MSRYLASLTVTSPYGEDAAHFYFTVGPADSDWMFYWVDTGSHFASPSLALIDGCPAIGYTDCGSEDGPTIQKYAINTEPDGSGDWIISAVEQWGGAAWGYYSVRLAEYRGSPAFLYRYAGLWVAVSDSPQGTGEWSIFSIAEQGGVCLGFVVAGDRLAVSFSWEHASMAGIGEDLRLAVSGSAGDLDSWAISDVFAEPDEARMSYGRESSLAVVDGRLAVTCLSYAFDERLHEGELRFAMNDELDGSGEWKRYLIERSDGGVATGADTSLAEVEGRPAIAYCRQEHATPGGNPNRHSSLKFTVNTKSDGSGYWNRFTLDSGHWADNPSLAVVGGRPGIAFSRGSFRDSPNDDVLVYGECSQADGTGVWNWEVLDPRPDAGLYPSLCVLADGRPAIAYFDRPNGWVLLAVRDY